MREKGFAAPVVIVGVILGVALLSVGAVQSKKDLSQKLQTAVYSNLGINASDTSSSNKSTEAEVKATRDKKEVNPDMIIISDKIYILDGESTYKFYLPKKGGEVKGTISGVCNGNITGTYDGKHLGIVSGNIAVNCPAGPGNFFKPQVKIQYEGKVNLAEGKINGPWKMTEPITFQSEFQLPFTPTSADQNPGDNKDKLVASGYFQFSENKIPYEFSVPKNGGSVTGSIDGVCSGAPEGTFDGKDGGKVEGTLRAKCTMGPSNLVNVNIEIKYEGTVSIKENKAFINYEMVKPIPGQRGYVPINFK